MMVDLDNIQEIKKIDKNGALESISQLAYQCRQAWKEARQISFPENYKRAKNIICVGMGGSAYGVRIVKSLYDGAEMSKVPIEIVSNYWLPGYTDSNTLVVLSSYSGDTEEVLFCAEQAKKVKALVTGITLGGSLGYFLEKNNYPGYIFEAQNNPSRQPRMGQGYLIVGLLAILSNLGFIPVGDKEIEEIISFLTKQNKKLGPDSPRQKNLAMQLAYKLSNFIPVLIVADFLAGAAHAIRNPFHETAKQFALYFVIPELNHHLMEGLKFPEENKNMLYFLFVESNLYDKRNRRRMILTREVVKKYGINTDKISLSSKSALGQTMELIQLGSWLTFYLAILRDIDPTKVPWVNHFKAGLKKS